MKKKLALIVISLDECFTKTGFSGGGHKVTKNLILGLIASNLFEIDIFCKKSDISSLDGINSIKVLNKKTFLKELEHELEQKDYDFILSSDVLLPFGNLIIHSNSAKYKTKNGKKKFIEQFLKIYNRKKIKKEEKTFKLNDKNIFTVSESLKKDYVQSYNIDENKVFAMHPGLDDTEEFSPPEKKENFTIGSFAGGGLNKGGYLLLFALNKLKKTPLTLTLTSHQNITGVLARQSHKGRGESQNNIKARIIFPKIHKAGVYKFLINILKLNDIVELLPKQKDMKAFYQSIDCYVLPSLNEAFGLVVVEAAAYSRPSLVSSTTGVCELIKDGENGFVFDRAKNPLKNLTESLKRAYELYFSDYSKYIEISKNAYEMSKTLEWQKFVDTIVTNLKEEK